MINTAIHISKVKPIHRDGFMFLKSSVRAPKSFQYCSVNPGMFSQMFWNVGVCNHVVKPSTTICLKNLPYHHV